jgi:MFS superfamily sulfate permease-like transporter
MELIVEALWVSSKSLIWSEWIIVASTTLGSSFVGFAPGIGVGLGIMILLQYWIHLKDTVGYSASFSHW